MDTKRSSEPATRNSTVAQKGRGSSAMKNSKQEEVKTKEHFRRSTGSISSLSNVGETVIGSLRTSTVGPKRDRKDATKERSASKIEVIRTTMKQVGPVVAADVYEKLNLYVLADKFYLEPRDRNGELRSESYLEIDRVSDELHVRNASESPIPIVHAEISSIFGIVGVVKLISGNGLIIIKRAELVGEINGHDIWTILETEVIPYKKGTMHLTEKQRRFNKHFIDMIQLVLSTGGFYYSTTFDITRTFQWLSENATPGFRDLSLMERADDRFVWNRYLSAQFIADGRLGKYTLPIMHGFVGIRRAAVNVSNVTMMPWSLTVLSSRAGVRFFMRGVNSDGHSANYVETEQIIQHDRGSPDNRVLSSFVQVRGSIPLYWSQHPNLRWQPVPTMKPNDHQLEAYVKHMKMQREIYGGKHVIVNLINQKGREKRIGGELERTVVQGNLDFVRYNAFDFHKECHAMNWDRLSILQDQLTHEINSFGFFLSSLANPDKVRTQAGYFRTNCMDCLDRTNVVQAMIAKESLLQQLIFMDIAPIGSSIDQFAEFNSLFKNLWADNGDECSKQYAGTGALKADFTRIGKRTYGGAINDGINALTRYFKNNFYDGYRQDAIDLFLGNFRIDPNNLPDSLEQSVINFDFHGVAILFAIFAATMVILCLIVSESYTVSVFWLIVLALLLTFIVLNGEEFVNSPKLKVD